MGLPRACVGEMIDLAGLTPAQARRRTGTYSLGMRQRLGVAHALLGKPQVLQGMACGMLLLITAAAIVLYYVVPNLRNALFSAVTPLKPIAAWFDLNKAQSPLYTHDMTSSAWLHLAVAVAIWIAVPLAAGWVRALRAEIKPT